MPTGRTVLSAIVTVVMGITAILLGLPLVPSIMAVTFVGGYIPYIGAFVAGAFTVLLAVGDGGLPPAVIVLVVSLAALTCLKNFVEPKVMGKSLDIHPLVVLIVTALGGLLAGIIGLIIAVPLAVIIGSAIGRLRASGSSNGLQLEPVLPPSDSSVTPRRDRSTWTSHLGERQRHAHPMSEEAILALALVVFVWAILSEPLSALDQHL